MQNLTGQSLGRYHILEPLGEGGMAVVYKAYDTRLECEVAIKIIRTEKLSPESSPLILKRFENEAQKTAKLTHPNIVPVIDYGKHNNIPFLVMKFIPGGTLKQKTGTPLGYKQAIKTILPIVEALDYAHKNGVIHRDVKPANILITETGEPMLSDFGIAKIIEMQDETMEHLTNTGVGIGTPEYMSPEQASGKKVDPRTDIYALGVVLFELITGRKPYTADTPLAVIIKQTTDPVPNPRFYIKNLPDSVTKILFKALAKKTSDRYTNMREFGQELQKVLLENQDLSIERKFTGISQNKFRHLVWIVPTLVIVTLLIFIFQNRLNHNSAVEIITITPSVIVTPENDIKPIEMQTLVPTTQPTLDQSEMYNNPFAGPIPNDALYRIGKGYIKGAAISPDEKELIILTDLGLYYYNQETLQLNKYDGLKRDIYLVTTNIHNKQIAYVSYDGNIDIWEGNKSKNIFQLPVNSSFIKILFSDKGNFFTAITTDSIYVWKVEDWSLIQKIHLDKGCISDIAISPDETVFINSNMLNSFTIWNLKTGEKEKELAIEKTTWSTTGDCILHTNEIKFSPDGKEFSLSAGGILTFWNAETWDIRNTKKMYNNVYYSADNTLIAYDQYDKLQINERLTGKLLKTITKNQISTDSFSSGNRDYYTKAFFSSNSDSFIGINGDYYFAFGDYDKNPKNIWLEYEGNEIAKWDIFENTSPQINDSHESLYNPSFNSQNELITMNKVFMSADDNLMGPFSKWSVENFTRNKIYSNQPNNLSMITYAISPEATYIVGADNSYKEKNLYLWDLESGSYLRNLPGHNSDIMEIEFSPDGKLLASSDNSGIVILWDIESRSIIKVLSDSKTEISNLSFSKDNKYLAGTNNDSTIIWDVSDNYSVRVFGEASVINFIVFSADGKSLITGDTEGAIKFRDVSSWEITNTLQYNVKGICGLAQSGNGLFLAAVSCDGYITIWNYPELKVYKEYFDKDSNWGISFSDDGTLLASTSAGSTVILWSVSETVKKEPTKVITQTQIVNEEKPDLVAISATFDDFVGSGGSGYRYFTLCLNIRNSGVGPAPASELIVKTNSFSSKPYNVPILNPGDSYNVCDLLGKNSSEYKQKCENDICKWVVPDFCQPLTFTIDWENSIAESNETNNFFAGEVCYHSK